MTASELAAACRDVPPECVLASASLLFDNVRDRRWHAFPAPLSLAWKEPEWFTWRCRGGRHGASGYIHQVNLCRVPGTRYYCGPCLACGVWWWCER